MIEMEKKIKIEGKEAEEFLNQVSYRICATGKGKKDFYFLAKTNDLSNEFPINGIPKNHYIEIDNVYLKFRLCGPKTGNRSLKFSEWAYMPHNQNIIKKLAKIEELFNVLKNSVSSIYEENFELRNEIERLKQNAPR